MGEKLGVGFEPLDFDPTALVVMCYMRYKMQLTYNNIILYIATLLGVGFKPLGFDPMALAAMYCMRYKMQQHITTLFYIYI